MKVCQFSLNNLCSPFGNRLNALIYFRVIYGLFFRRRLYGLSSLMRWKDGHACWESLKPRGHGLCESVIPAFAFRD